MNTYKLLFTDGGSFYWETADETVEAVLEEVRQDYPQWMPRIDGVETISGEDNDVTGGFRMIITLSELAVKRMDNSNGKWEDGISNDLYNLVALIHDKAEEIKDNLHAWEYAEKQDSPMDKAGIS